MSITTLSAKFKPKRTLAIDALAMYHISGRSKRDPNAIPSDMLVEGVNSFNEKNRCAIFGLVFECAPWLTSRANISISHRVHARITKLSAKELRKRIWEEFSARFGCIIDWNRLSMLSFATMHHTRMSTECPSSCSPPLCVHF